MIETFKYKDLNSIVLTLKYKKDFAIIKTFLFHNKTNDLCDL